MAHSTSSVTKKSDAEMVVTGSMGIKITSAVLILVVIVDGVQIWGECVLAVAALVSLTTVLVLSAHRDVLSRQIPNAVTYTGFLSGVSLKLVPLAVPVAGSSNQTISKTLSLFALVDVESAMMGAGWCFAITFVMYAAGACGAGDVKLAAVIGLFLGPALSVQALLWCYISAAVLVSCTTATKAIMKKAQPVVRSNSSATDASGAKAEDDETLSLLKQSVPLGLYLAIGTLIAITIEVAS